MRIRPVTHRLTAATGCALVLAVAACAPTLVPLEARPPLLELPRVGSAPATSATSASVRDRTYFTDSPLMVPVVGLTPRAVRDDFNAPRSGGRTHRAFDLMAPRGTPVIAAAAGQIIALRQNNLGGITIYLLDESQGYMHYYAHLDRYARGLREGMRVPQGQLIGYVGHTGNASPNAPHLHFQVLRMEAGRRDWWNAAAVDVREFMVLPGRAAASD